MALRRPGDILISTRFEAEPTPSVKASDANLRRNHEWFHSSVGLECRPVTPETGVQIPLVPPIYALLAQLVGSDGLLNRRSLVQVQEGAPKCAERMDFLSFNYHRGYNPYVALSFSSTQK